MKILHAIASVDLRAGGPIEAIQQISQVLVRQGHRIDVACLDDPDSNWLTAFPFQTFALGPGITGYNYSQRFVPWLRQHAPSYDCVIVHGIWQYHSFGTWRALHRTQVPYFVYPHGMLDPWFKRSYPLKHLKKWLYWPWAEYRVLRDARAVLFTCEQEKILARQSFWLYRCNQVVVNFGTAAPAGDPGTQRQIFLKQFPHLRQKRCLVFMGRIHVKKGCDLLIEAFARVAGQDDSLHLVMAGPDQTGWQADLQAIANQLGIADKITWTGMLQGDLKWGAFYAAEALVLPSHQENFGIVVAEAMACGVPVLISNQVNIWREIEADGAGLVARDDRAGTLELLQRWQALSPEEQQGMGTRARQSFKHRFEIHQATQSLLDVLAANFNPVL